MTSIPFLEDTVKNNLSNLLSWLSELKFTEKISQEIKHIYTNRILEYQVNMSVQFSQTQTLLHKDMVPFLEIYEPLTIKGSENFDITRGVTKKMFQKYSQISLWGNAGNGKTTIMKYIFIDSVVTDYKIPILIHLRDIEIVNSKKKKKEPENLLYNYLLKHLKFYNISEFETITKSMLINGKFLILLDGYDEINFEKSSILNNHIYEFTSLYNKCSYLITSRFDSKAISLHSFKPFSIAPLTHEGIKSFISKQFFSKTSRVEEIIRTIFKKENIRYLEYLENPLFLILFLNSYDFYPNIPAKRSRFFENVYEALYEKHDSFAKLGFNRKRYVDLMKEDFEKVLFSFSFISLFSKKISFDVTYIYKILNKIKEQNLYSFQNDNYVKELKINLNLIEEEEHNFKFIHLSLQEFFAAKFIAYLKEDEIKVLIETLAEVEIKFGGNQFFLETLAELYPQFFYEFYIPKNLLLYCETFKWIFQKKGYYDNEFYQTAVTRYLVTKSLIEKNEAIHILWNEFLSKNHQKFSTTMFTQEFKNTPNEKVANDIQIIYYHNNELITMFDDYFQKQSFSTRKILEIVFNKETAISKPFGRLSLPKNEDNND